MRGFGAGLLAAVLLCTAGCGGDDDADGARLSTATVAKSLRSNDSFLGSAASQLDDQKAACIAKALVGSDISDKALEALLGGDLGYKLSAADEAAMTPVMTSVGTCIQDAE